MKVLLLNGSPHKHGCTHTALAEAADAIKAAGLEANLFWIGKEPIRGCVACLACRKLGGRCVYGDDVVNAFIEEAETSDGFIFGSPVYYASPNGAILAMLDRIFYAAGSRFCGKPGAAVVSARRAGTTTSLDALNRYFPINGMPTVPSQYWPMVHGLKPDDVRQDREGMQTMRVLGRNMAWMLKCFEAGRAIGIAYPPAEESREWTHFVR